MDDPPCSAATGETARQISAPLATPAPPQLVKTGGEPGSGREFIARALHAQGRRQDEGFVVLGARIGPERLSEALAHGSAGLATARPRTIFLRDLEEMPRPSQERRWRCGKEVST